MSFCSVMWTVIFLVVKFNFVASVYFTISDVNLTIPRAISTTSKIRTLPIIEMSSRSTLNDDTKKTYSLNITGEYLYINSTTGRLFLTPTFLKNIKEIGEIKGEAYVRDVDSGDRDQTTLRVIVSPQDEWDCDKFVEEICFCSGATYRTERRTGAMAMGPLSSAYLMEMCPYKINYTLLAGENFRVIPPDDETSFWSIGTTQSFEKMRKPNLSLRLLCTLENTDGKEEGSIRKIEKNLQVKLLNFNEFAPKPQYLGRDITLSNTVFKKNHILNDPNLIFTDQDVAEVNRYEANIIQQHGKVFLKAICTKHPVPNEGNGIRTAIHCSLRFEEDVTFRHPTYSFIIQLKDVSMRNKRTDNMAQLPVTFVFEVSPQSLTMPKIYPKSIVKIFKTAAPLARVTQPVDYNIRNCSDFKMTESIRRMTDSHKGQIFSVTNNEGIIFVHDFMMLRRISAEFVSINVSWSKNNRREYDEIQVRIVIEPNQTCNNIKSVKGWTSCAEFETSHACQKRDSCAYGTGGSASVEFRRGPERCMWRGDVTSPNITHVYSTCSPDIHTCPDGICDSLEQLNYAVCPQDCTSKIVWPLKINAATGRGVDESSGTVACSSTNCYSTMPRRSNDKDNQDFKKKKGKLASVPSTTNNTIVFHSNSTNENNANITTGKYSSMIGKCGTVCSMGIGAGALFLAVSIASIVLCWRLNKTKKSVRKNFEENNREMSTPLSISAPGTVPHQPFSLNFNMTPLMNDSLIFNNIMKYSSDPRWEFPRSQLAVEQILGEGEFGRVLRAKASNISGLTGYTTVAVKTLKDDARESELNDLLSEYQLLKEVSHPNVIRLLGVCTEPGGPVYLVIEYCEYGSLRNYLRKSRMLHHESNKLINTDEVDYDEPKTSDITPKDLLSFAWQICNGMSYLSEIKLVHRDLAARNVLLAADKICKVSDFGLTRDVYEDNAYLKRSKGRVPVKWMAPESLADHIYTSKSDVWSFGVLVWELITLGSTPYPGIVVQNLYHLLREGYRMERPNNCSPALYNIMRKCWNLNPQQRPSFQELSKRFEKLLEDNMEYINLSDNVIHNRGYFLSPFEEDEQHEGSSSEISSLNYLSRTGSCEKIVAIEKALNEDLEKMTDAPKTMQGYETPVKMPRRVKTPSNENPGEYTDMEKKRESDGKNDI